MCQGAVIGAWGTFPECSTRQGRRQRLPLWLPQRRRRNHQQRQQKQQQRHKQLPWQQRQQQLQIPLQRQHLLQVKDLAATLWSTWTPISSTATMVQPFVVGRSLGT